MRCDMVAALPADSDDFLCTKCKTQYNAHPHEAIYGAENDTGPSPDRETDNSLKLTHPGFWLFVFVCHDRERMIDFVSQNDTTDGATAIIFRRKYRLMRSNPPIGE